MSRHSVARRFIAALCASAALVAVTAAPASADPVELPIIGWPKCC